MHTRHYSDESLNVKLYQQAPPEESKFIFLQYADFEEKHGLTKHTMAIYEQAAKTVPKNERLEVYDIYIQKASDFYGIGKVRYV